MVAIHVRIFAIFAIASTMAACGVAQDVESPTKTSLLGSTQQTLEQAGAKYDRAKRLLTDEGLGISARLPLRPICSFIKQQGKPNEPPQVKTYEVNHRGVNYIVGSVLLHEETRGKVGKAMSAQQVIEGMRRKMLADKTHFRRVFNREIKVGEYEGRDEVIVMRQIEIDGKMHDRSVMYSRTIITQQRAFTAQASVGEENYKLDEPVYKEMMVLFLRSMIVEPAQSTPHSPTDVDSSVK